MKYRYVATQSLSNFSTCYHCIMYNISTFTSLPRGTSYITYAGGLYVHIHLLRKTTGKPTPSNAFTYAKRYNYTSIMRLVFSSNGEIL